MAEHIKEAIMGMSLYRLRKAVSERVMGHEKGCIVDYTAPHKALELIEHMRKQGQYIFICPSDFGYAIDCVAAQTYTFSVLGDHVPFKKLGESICRAVLLVHEGAT